MKPIAAAPAVPAAKPAPPASVAKDARKNPFDAPREEDASAKDAERKRQMRKQLADIEAKEEKESRKYDQLLVDCRYGRNALQFLAYGAVGNALGCFFYFLFFAGCAILVPFLPLLWLAGLGVVAHWVFSLVGYGYGVVGPRQTRGLCITGGAITVLNALATAFVAVLIMANVVASELGFESGATRSFAIEGMLMCNAFNNLSCLTDVPVYALTEGVHDWRLYLFPLIGAAFEFMKMSLLSILTHRMCMLGKGHDLASDGMRFVYRMFGVIVVVLFLKLGLWIFFKLLGGGDPLAMMWFAIPLIMISTGYFMWSAACWYMLYQTQTDAMEIVTADRFADKRERLDLV